MNPLFTHYTHTIIQTIVNLVISVLIAWVIHKHRPGLAIDKIRAILVLAGTFLLMVAGLGGVGWQIQTFDGDSALENFDGAVLFILAHLGGSCIFVDLFLTAFDKFSDQSR